MNCEIIILDLEPKLALDFGLSELSTLLSVSELAIPVFTVIETLNIIVMY